MTVKRSVARFGMLGALCTLLACSSGGHDSLADLGVDDGASKGASTSAKVTSDKSTRLALDTGALVDIPAGAVSKDIELKMERPEDGKALKLVDRFKTAQDRIVSAPYVLTPHGTMFKEDVTVTLPLAKMGSRDVSVAWLEDEDDTEWKVLGVAKSNGKKASITLKHFSVLVVVEDTSGLPAAEDAGDEPSDAGTAHDASATDAARDDVGQDDAGLDGEVSEEAGSVDAGAAGDASVLRDAGDYGDDAAASSDATTTTSDGSTRTDAETFPTDGGADASADAGPPAASLYAKLQSCGLVSTDGGFSEMFSNDSVSVCLRSCILSGTCQDVEVYRCALDAGLSTATVNCVAACTSFICPNQTVAARCDSNRECPSGEDEVNCLPHFDCATGQINESSRCDGLRDCANGEDELGCYTCDQGQTVLAPDRACDGYVDCYDESDESSGCAVLSCGAI